MQSGKFDGRCESARVIQVIEIKASRGSGIISTDPVRTVTEYWSLEGEKLAEKDTYLRSIPSASAKASSEST